MNIMNRNGLLLGIAALTAAHDLQAIDMKEFSVFKGQKFTQTGASAPQPASGNSALFDAAAVPLVSMFVTSCALQPPTGALQAMTKTDDRYILTGSAATPAALDSSFAPGNYSFKYTGQNDGSATVVIALPQNQYPPAPALNNFTAAQSVDPSVDFTLSWNSWAGGTDQDTISLSILDSGGSEVFSTSDGDLNGTSTSLAIPSDVLEVKKSYTATLTFRKLVVNESLFFGLETHLGGFYTATEFSLKTVGAGGGNADTTPPLLLSSISPTNGLISTMTFSFNEPMAESQSVQWSANINTASIFYQWTDETTLMCLFPMGLPSSGTATWTLNPTAGDANNFKDLAGNALARTTGSFALGSGGSTSTNNPCESTNSTPQVGTFFIIKDVTYIQSNSGAPVISPDDGASFSSMVSVPSGAEGKVTVQIPTVPPTVQPLMVMPFSLGNNVYQAFYFTNYPTEAALEQAVPSGIFKLTVAMPNYVPAEVTLPSSGFPNTPHIVNYDAAQRVNPDLDFTLTWDAFAGASGHDSILLSIVENGKGGVFQAPDECVPVRLAVTDTSIVIPKGVIQLGKAYKGSLTFSHSTAHNVSILTGSTNGGMAVLEKTTYFSIGAGNGITLINPRFASIKKTASGVTLQIECNPGRPLVVKKSASLTTGIANWTDAFTTNVVASPVTIELPREENVRFYRAVQN